MSDLLERVGTPEVMLEAITFEILDKKLIQVTKEYIRSGLDGQTK